MRTLAGCQCCLELEKRIQDRLRENSNSGKKNREGNFFFYFLQKPVKCPFDFRIKQLNS